MKCAIIMAGGKGTRMKATCPKVMCNVLFVPMISYVVDAVKEAGAEDICVITGYKHELLEKYLAEKDLNLTATLDAKTAYSDADFVVIAAPTNVYLKLSVAA